MATRTKKSWAKSKVWRKTFAPKRPAWYSAFNARVEPHIGITALIVASVFFFGGVFSLEAVAERVALQRVVPMHPVADSHTSQLAAAAAYITRNMHVPSGYTDTSLVPPPIGQ